MDSINRQLLQGLITLYQNYSATTGTLTTFDELKQMAINPKATAKNDTALIVPTDAPGKTKEVILYHNQMTMLWVDIDENDILLVDVLTLCKEYQINNAVVYSTSSAMSIKDGVMQGHKWRVLIPLSHALSCEHWLILQQALAQIFNACSSAVRIQQGFFAPTNPDGYYEQAIIEGDVLNADTLTAPLLEVINQIQAEEQALQEQAARAPIKSREATGANGRIIDMVNAAYRLEDVLSGLGYVQKTRDKWLHPLSTSGAAGVVILEGRYFSHHECDLLADGHTHDAFDLLTFWNFGGDVSKSVAHFAAELDREANQERRLEYVKAQSILSPSPFPGNPAETKFGSLFVDGNSLLTGTSKIKYLVHGHIEIDSLIAGFGPFMSGKTFVFVDMGLCCATGTPWAGHATKKGHVFYFCAEGRGGISRRIKAWSKKNGNPDLSYFHVSKQNISFTTDFQHVVNEIESVSTELSPVLLIIDTLSRHFEGDENSSKDMMKFIKLLEKLREHFPGCCVLVVHHVGNDSEQSYRTRGSSALPSACDSIFSVNKGQITCMKSKDSELPKPIEFKLVQEVIGNDEETGEDITSCVPVYGERSERNKSADFTHIEAVAIRALVEVSAKEKRNVNGRYIGKTESWREAFYNIRKAEDSEVTPAALKKAFQRTITGLVNKGALEQLSTDSILILDEHQERINGAILAENMRLNHNGTRDISGTCPLDVSVPGQGTLWGH